LIRLLIFAPTPPSRGGIPRHTHLLSDALSEKYLTTVYSSTKLYPKWLYPGKGKNGPHVPYLEKPLNYKCVTTSDIRLLLQVVKGNVFDVALIPWWTVARMPQTLAMVMALRLRGTPFAFFCHNVLPHDSGAISKFLTRLVLRTSHAHLVQGEAEGKVLANLIPGSKPSVVFHPSWEEHEAQPNLKISNTFLFFGFVRAYKGIELLIEAIPLLDSSLDYEIVIMGEVWDKKLEVSLTKLAKSFPQVKLHLRYVDEEEMAEAFQSSRAILMPYLSATGSGVMGLAKQYKRPVIASDVASFRDDVEQGVDGLLFDRRSPAELAKAIEALIRDPKLAQEPWGGILESHYDWSSLAKDVSKVLKKII